MDLTSRSTTVEEWCELIDRCYERDSEPLVNLPSGKDRVYDAIFIGGGPGGRFGAAYMQAMGGTPLIVERWPFLGGSCPHNACVPHHVFSDCAAEFDLLRWLRGRLGFPDFTNGRGRILDIVRMFVGGRGMGHAFMNWQSKEQLGLDYILNVPARVIDSHTVEVDGSRFRARAIVLGTGARSIIPDVPGTKLHGVFTHETLVEELDYEPNRIVVIGGSKTAVEYGSFFHAAGAPVTIIARSPILRFEPVALDEDARTYVIDMMRSRGMAIYEEATVEAILGRERVEAVRFRTAQGAEQVVPADFVLLGTGMQPNVEPFASKLGLSLGARGEVIVDSRMMTSVPDVFAVGDMIGHPMEMWKARKGGMTAARNIMGEEFHLDIRNYPDFLHTTYEVSWVGLTEAQARERYPNVIVLKMPPGNPTQWDLLIPLADRVMLYAFLEPRRSGFQKCVIDGDSRRVLGFCHVGYGCKDSFQYLDYLLKQGVTIDDMGSMNELFLNPGHFIQLCRLRAGMKKLTDLA
ncbi:MAG: NAD(P)/FAD-dependent oxidoreductase [Candidatus Rokubacteria bacterium]|nr:NAD(P)/FAD-dependent oxidoreductase [Candidatus Rokubacteria bacterium]